MSKLISFLNAKRQKLKMSLEDLADAMREAGSDQKKLSRQLMSDWLRRTGKGVPADEFRRLLTVLEVEPLDVVRAGALDESDAVRYGPLLFDTESKYLKALRVAITMSDEDLENVLGD